MKFLIPLFLVVCYWVYLNIYLGFFLSKIFYNFFDNIEFQKKFSFKNITKIIIDFFCKLIKNWFIRIDRKFLLLNHAIDGLIRAVKIFLKKFKSLLKFKHNFRLLKNLLLIFWNTFLIFCSLVNEILFLNNIRNWVIGWINLIRLLMAESVFITRIVYGLYLILLALFGILLGFFLGIYQRENQVNERYIFLLLLLLQILYSNGFDDVLFEILRRHSLEPRNIEQFSKFSLQVCELSNSRPSKLFLKELVEKPQIPLPFPIIEDPLVVIETEVFWKKPINYKLELFKFYQNVNKKVKS